ncbi:MAG: hypothetical protein K0R39_2592 [Symbiobacteriaceae bacterium]|jgi:hypothetical protein|nr:hypothetical protein [Symbiobacteriaceae bacterium]
MKPSMPRIGGLELDPQADLALPLLLNLGITSTVLLVAVAIESWAHVELVDGVTFFAFLFAFESYLFTTVFTVREADVPDAMRWVEMALMAFAAKLLAALPVTVGLVDAVVGGWNDWATWLGFGLIAYGWVMGAQSARQVQYLHPGLAKAAAEQDQIPRDDHGRAFINLQTQIFAQIAVVAAVLGIGSWIRGDVRLWGWSWLGFGLLLQTALAAGTLLVAAQLKSRITWMQERIEADPRVFARWAPIGLSLLLAPMLLALLLPAGPRIPLERLAPVINGMAGEPIEITPPPIPQAPEMQPPILDPGQEPWIRWTFSIPTWFWWALGGLAVLWVLKVAAQQLLDRAGELKGIWAILAALAAWYLALAKVLGGALGGVLRQAVATPAEALGALFSEAGAVGRFLPVARRAPGDPRAALRFYFARLQVEAGRKGLKRAGGTTAAEYGRRLAEAAPERSGEIEALTQAYQEARYSDLPIEGEKVSFARRAWVAIARSLKKG